jgi:hypothetical protein
MDSNTAEIVARVAHLERQVDQLGTTCAVMTIVITAYLLAGLWMIERRWLAKRAAASTKGTTASATPTVRPPEW